MIRQSVWKVRLNALGENTNIYLHVVIHNPENVKIGNNVFIAEFVHIWGGGGIEIGDYTIIAAHSTITSLTHDTNAFAYEKTLIKNRLGLLNVFGLVQALSFYLELQSVKGLLSVREPL